MSYRPDNQQVEPPLRKIIEGADEFSAAVDKRIEAGTTEWQQSHLEEIDKLRRKLLKLKLKLARLADENW